MALLAGLEVPPPSGAGPRQAAAAPDPEGYEEPFYPEEHAPARPTNRPDRGDAWEPPTGEPDEDAPTDGRQLLGWASKQIPDLKGILIGYGKKKGLRSKIVEWTPEQVARPTGSPAAGWALRPADRALPADASGRRVRAIGLGLVRETTPQPLDRRSTAEV